MACLKDCDARLICRLGGSKESGRELLYAVISLVTIGNDGVLSQALVFQKSMHNAQFNLTNYSHYHCFSTVEDPATYFTALNQASEKVQ